jgi:hypothetical protein
MYHVGEETHACAKDAADIYGEKVVVREDAVMTSSM